MSSGNPASSGSAKNSVEDTVVRRLVPYILTPDLLRGLEHDWPNSNFIAKRNATVHTHARMAYERRQLENDCCTRLQTLYGPEAVFVDIGGNPNRHTFRRDGHQFHSCCPVLSPEDSNRARKHLPDSIRCSCSFQECKCIDHPTAYLSIHSLYYLTADDVLLATHRSVKGHLIAVCHRFPNAADRIAGSESTYEQIGGGRVRMSVKGNSTVYEHSNLHWLSLGYHSNGVRAVSWTLSHVGPHSEIYDFHVAPVGLTANTSHALTLSACLADKNHYGAVLSGVSGAGREPATAFLDHALASIDKIVSCYGFLDVVVSSEQRSCIVPKQFVDDLALKMAYQPRNESTFQNLVQRGKNTIAKYNLPDTIKKNAVQTGCIVAFSIDVEKEAGLLNAMTRTNRHTFHNFNALLKFQHCRRWLPLLSIFALPLLYRFRQKIWILLLLAAFYQARQSFGKAKSLRLLEQGYQRYDVSGESFHMPQGVFQHEMITCLSQNSSVPINPIRQNTTLVLPENITETVRRDLAGVGILFPSRIPISYAANGHNEVRAIANRALTPVADCDEKFFDLYENWVFDNLKALFGLRDQDSLPEIQGDFYSWNSRFPIVKQRKHNRARETLKLESCRPDIHAICRKKAFSKREKLAIGGFVIEHKAPRVIQGCTDEYNVIVGPWVHSFSKFLQTTWHDANPLFYASGTSANAIGRWYTLHSGGLWGHNDFAKFDVTFHVRFCKMEIRLFHTLGAPRLALELALNAIPTNGAGRHGTLYKIDGTRGSGEPPTSAGNSFTNITTHAFCAHYDPTTGTVAKYDPNRIFVAGVGDDDISCIPANSLAPRNIPFDLYMSKLGLKCEYTNARDLGEIEFCSGLMYPSDEGPVLGPKIGRCLQKVGWYLDCTKSTTDELLYSVGLGLRKDTNHIPILRKVAAAMIRVALQRGKCTLNGPVEKDHSGRPHVERKVEIVEDVYRLIWCRYGLNRDQVAELEQMIDDITDLPVSLSHPNFDVLFNVDC